MQDEIGTPSNWKEKECKRIWPRLATLHIKIINYSDQEYGYPKHLHENEMYLYTRNMYLHHIT
jgi:hypothetical protein